MRVWPSLCAGCGATAGQSLLEQIEQPDGGCGQTRALNYAPVRRRRRRLLSVLRGSPFGFWIILLC